MPQLTDSSRGFIRGLRIAYIAVSLLLAAGTILAAYGGYVSPQHFKALPAVMAMTFPFWIILQGVLALVNLMFCRKALIISAAVMLICLKPFLTFCPLNIFNTPKPDAEQKEEQFSLMTYNVLNLMPYRGTAADQSATMQTVINYHPDYVCFQEGSVPTVSKSTGVTAGQLAEFKKEFPVRISNHNSLPIFSGNKIRQEKMPELPGGSGDIACYRTEVNGRRLTIYNLHLQSIGLNDDDKELYREITDGQHPNSNIRRAKRQLYAKLRDAFLYREEQAKIIRNILDEDTARNVIICGDFNDIPGCYAMRTIMGKDFKDAYTERGFGPTHTYRADRFYFHIDQVLYRGDLLPVKISVLKAGSSDHYPVLTSFTFNKKQ